MGFLKDLRAISVYLIVPALVLILHAFLLFFSDVYVAFPWLDIPMHLLGGFSAGYFFIFSLSYFRREKNMKFNKFFAVLFVISLVLFIAVMWEFLEFSLEIVTGFNFQGTLQDTMGDLFMGIIGGIVSTIVFSVN